MIQKDKRNVILLFSVAFLSLAAVVFLQPHFVFAQSVVDQVNEQLGAGSKSAGYGTSAPDPREIASMIIQVLLGLMGAVFTFLFILAGYWMITANGEEEKVGKARKTMQGAVVGLLVIMMAYSISYFVGKRAQQATGYGEGIQPQKIEELNRSFNIWDAF